MPTETGFSRMVGIASKKKAGGGVSASKLFIVIVEILSLIKLKITDCQSINLRLCKALLSSTYVLQCDLLDFEP